MKILFVIPSLKGGGQERAGMLLCNFLMQAHEVTAVCFEPQQKDEYAYRCAIFRLPIRTTKGILPKAVAGINRVRALKKIKKRLQPDVSIAFGNTAIILNTLSTIGEKNIASIRQSFSVIGKDRSLPARAHIRLYVWALRKADVIVPVSSAINKELKEYFNIPNERFINNGISAQPSETSSSSRPIALTTNKHWLVHSGRFDRSKGQWHLVKIFVQVRKVLPGAALIFLGSTDEAHPESLSIAAYCKKFLTAENISWSSDLHMPADVIFAGHVNNPSEIIRQCTLFVFPSLWEGFPNALLEAMRCGVPVVAADCATGPAEILRKGDESFGILLPPFTDDFPPARDTAALEASWGEIIVSLLKDPAELDRLAHQSRRRAAEFSENIMGTRWLELLQEVAVK